MQRLGREFNSDHEAEDNPPRIRFDNLGMEDRHRGNLTGNMEYRNTTVVYISAYGDTKCEVIDIVKGFGIEQRIVQKEVTKEVTRAVQKIDDEGQPYYEDLNEMETKTVEVPEFIYTETTPWFDKLKERLKHGQITQDYHDYCHKMYKRWEETGVLPVDGEPLAEWKMISAALRSKFIEMGINTVERLADATEEAMQSAGMGARDAKRKATNYLNVSNDSIKAAAAITNMEQKLERAEAATHKMQSDYDDKIAELEAKIKANEPKKIGRPKKES